MENDIAALIPSPAYQPLLSPVAAMGVAIEAWLASLDADSTRRGYRKDLARFAAWAERSPAEAVTWLLGNGRGAAVHRAEAYRTEMLKVLAPATLNRRLAALRSLVNFLHRRELVGFQIDVKGTLTIPYRDTKGPSPQVIQAMLATLRSTWPLGQRLRIEALLQLLLCRGMRIGEALKIKMSDVDDIRGGVWVVGKGRREPVLLGLGAVATAALKAWIEFRGDHPGYVFTRLPSEALRRFARKGGDIAPWEYSAAYRSIRELAIEVGSEDVSPHGFRHAAITAVLQSGADIRTAAKWARHRSPTVTMLYDDSDLKNAGADAADQVSERLRTAPSVARHP